MAEAASMLDGTVLAENVMRLPARVLRSGIVFGRSPQLA